MLLLFDIDGTLVVSGGAGRRALARAFEELLGVSGAMDGIRLHGNTDPVIVETVFTRHLGRAPSGPEEFARVMDRYLVFLEEELRRNADVYRVLTGAREIAAAAVSAGCAVGLATGNVEPGARLKLTPGRLWDLFAFGGFGSDAADRAQLVRRGIERGQRYAEQRLGRRFEPEEILVLGDTERDVEAARAAGARSVGVLEGASDPETLKASNPDLVVGTLADEALWRLIGLS